MAKDVINHAATAEHKHGIESFRHVMEWGYALMPDGRYELLDIIAEGKMVACRVRVSGTMQGENVRRSSDGQELHGRALDGEGRPGALIQLGIIDPPDRFKADSPG